MKVIIIPQTRRKRIVRIERYKDIMSSQIILIIEGFQHDCILGGKTLKYDILGDEHVIVVGSDESSPLRVFHRF